MLNLLGKKIKLTSYLSVVLSYFYINYVV